MLIIYIDLDNKNLVSIELNLPSCLQVKKRKTWMISLFHSKKQNLSIQETVLSEPYQQDIETQGMALVEGHAVGWKYGQGWSI